MSRSPSLPSQLPILPLFNQSILFPGLLLRLSITGQSSTALLNHILRSDQATLVSLVLGCVPLRPGRGIAQVIGDDGLPKPALPAPENVQPSLPEDSKTALPEAEWGCSARIKSLSRLDRSLGASGFVLVVEGNSIIYWPHNRDISISSRQNNAEVSIPRGGCDPFPRRGVIYWSHAPPRPT
jgi:hypothetical protein